MSRLNYGVWKNTVTHIILLSIHLCAKDQSTLHQIDVSAHFSHFHSHHLTSFCSLSCSLTATETVSETGLCLFPGDKATKRHFKDTMTVVWGGLSGVATWGVRALSWGFTFPSSHTYCLTVGVSTLKLKIKFQVHFVIRIIFLHLTHAQESNCYLKPLTPRHCDGYLSPVSKVCRANYSRIWTTRCWNLKVLFVPLCLFCWCWSQKQHWLAAPYTKNTQKKWLHL